MQIVVTRHPDHHNEWLVEHGPNDDGDIEVTIFSGVNAEWRASEYAGLKIGFQKTDGA